MMLGRLRAKLLIDNYNDIIKKMNDKLSVSENSKLVNDGKIAGNVS